MNILMILSQLEVTGAEVYATSLSDKLIESGNKVIIISDTLTTATKAEYFPLPLNKRSILQRIKHVNYLVKFIKTKNIQIVHSHSRASSWPAHLATRICNIPMIYTAHGHLHVHKSKKLYPAFGDYILAVCDNIRDQLISDFKIQLEKIEVLPNGIDTELFQSTKENQTGEKLIISLIGRLSGPKGDIAFRILKELTGNPPDADIEIRAIGGKIIPERFAHFKGKVAFEGFQKEIRDKIEQSDIVIGSGRVAIKSLLMGKPTIAIGEKIYMGLVTTENLSASIKNNFGDISDKEDLQINNLWGDIEKAIKMKKVPGDVQNQIRKIFDINKISDRVDSLYKSLFSSYKKYEIPILAYHRVIDKNTDAGKHGTYIQIKQLDEQFRYLKRKGYTTITFGDLSNINHFDQRKKYLILTFDDGYEDNYILVFPLLIKYSLKAVIFLVTHEKSNIWDIKDEGRTFPLLKKEQIIEMSRLGVEFGAHSMTHPDLTAIKPEEARKEIRNSKLSIEEMIKKDVISFAYPYGKVNNEIKQIVNEEGFQYGVASVSGPLVRHKDLFEIRRIVIHPGTNLRRFARRASGNYTYKKNKLLIKMERALLNRT